MCVAVTLRTSGEEALMGEQTEAGLAPLRALLWENAPVPLCPRCPTAEPVTGLLRSPTARVTLSAVHRAPAGPGGTSSLTCAGPGTSFLSQRYLSSHLPCGAIAHAAG